MPASPSSFVLKLVFLVLPHHPHQASLQHRQSQNSTPHQAAVRQGQRLGGDQRGAFRIRRARCFPREYVTSKAGVRRVNIEKIERAFISWRSHTGLRMIDDDAPPELDA